MLLNIMNVLGMFLILLSIIVLIFTLISFILKKQFYLKKMYVPIIGLILGLIIIFIVSLNSNYVNNHSSLYTNPDNTIPLSINLISGSKVDYVYDKKYIYKFRHEGQDIFRLNPLSIKGSTNLVVTQRYRNNFLVPTVEVDNFKIIKR
ncbi:hypothetical protein MOO46_05380 [Apilactobacillus apisilvae]|uniref:DUF4811 domain-containing protein n=1 Tax=Apilactobacillus apisilvae TaxID=2923364 RepID=A0ABY4PGF5_9LACO|nr:hypothetical protein [Apilactobacillus apisilvae]UQS84682.1 hypothetical protein MOO46_05380 [Apilactobacillus apisilvae]